MIEVIFNIIMSALLALFFMLDANSAIRALERRTQIQEDELNYYGSLLGDDKSRRQDRRLF